jgi:hypothetical protein
MISNLVGNPLPIETDLPKDTFVDTEYWRLLFGLPIAFSVIQSALLLTVFNYETPKFHKQNGRSAELSAIMGKIYSHDQVQNRIDAIVIGSGGNSPSYSETLTSPKYMVATLIGCTLSLLQQLSGINIVMFYSSTILTSLHMRATLITALVPRHCELRISVPNHYPVQEIGPQKPPLGFQLCDFSLTDRIRRMPNRGFSMERKV